MFDSKNLLPDFPGIGNKIASDIISAVCYLHQNDIVHRDIKPSNVLVNNHYYSSLNASRLNAVFQEQPIECSWKNVWKGQVFGEEWWLVLEKPGATDRYYIVAGSANRIFVSPLGKEDPLNGTEVALIAERKSAKMPLPSSKIWKAPTICGVV